MSNEGKYLNQENIIKKVFDETTDSLRTTGMPAAGGATLDEQEEQTALLRSIANNEILSILENTPLVDSSINTIPKVSDPPLELIASTTANTLKIQSVDDIGAFMALYVGSLGAVLMIAALPLGGGEVEVDLPAGSRLSIGAIEDVDIVSGKIILNLLG